MTDVTSGSAYEGQVERLTRPDRVYVGWRYGPAHEDPGPPPPEPEQGGEPVPGRVTVGSQRRPGDNLLTGPLRVAVGGTAVGVLIVVAAWVSGLLPGPFAIGGLVACAAIFCIVGYAILQGEQVVRDRAREERTRLERDRRVRQRREDAAREEYAVAYREWELRRGAFEAQREWDPVALPQGVNRVDIAGGTLAGWSAAVTMLGAARLAAGSQVTVVDLSEGSVAADLVRLVSAQGEDPLVWVLPDDLPRLDLTRNLTGAELADVLSLVVSAGEEKPSVRDLSVDNSILDRILTIFAGRATIPQLAAALRALAQVGDPRDDLRRGLLSESQFDRVTTLFGRGAADKVVIERAWALEAQLRKLERLGSDPVPLPPSALHVVSLDRRAGVLTNRVLGTYVATALTHSLRAAPEGAAGRWEHTIFLCGADRLRGEVIDRITDACESTGTGLVLLYKSIPKHVRERLGRGHAAVGFMRLGNAEDARVAAAHIGADTPLLVAEVTETAGDSLSGHRPDDYASTVAYARRGERPAIDPLTDPIWVPERRSSPGGGAIVAGLASEGAWAASLGTAPAGRGRHREFRADQRRLQELPLTAMVFTHATSHGRRVELVDANPAIMTLPAAQPPPLPHPDAPEPGIPLAAPVPAQPDRRTPHSPYAAPTGRDPDAGGVEPKAEDAAGAGWQEAEERRSGARHAAPRGVAPRSPGAAPPLQHAGRHAKPGRPG